MATLSMVNTYSSVRALVTCRQRDWGGVGSGVREKKRKKEGVRKMLHVDKCLRKPHYTPLLCSRSIILHHWQPQVPDLPDASQWGGWLATKCASIQPGFKDVQEQPVSCRSPA